MFGAEMQRQLAGVLVKLVEEMWHVVREGGIPSGRRWKSLRGRERSCVLRTEHDVFLSLNYGPVLFLSAERKMALMEWRRGAGGGGGSLDESSVGASE